MELELVDFIKSNSNWEEILTQKPYGITIKRYNGYILFMYNQIDSNFNIPLVRECRGIILNEYDFIPVCVPFFKFGNYGESYVPNIDWSTARVQEKIDGSIIKVWFWNDAWHVSTNSTIDARDASLSMSFNGIENFFDLFMSADNVSLGLFDNLDLDKTYIFELVSPFNRVVVPYSNTMVYHIGTRNNWTLQELDENIGIQKPLQYNLYTLEDCIEVAKTLPFNDEGFVVVDGDYNRVKVKSLAYVAAHHLKNNGVITYKRILDMIRLNEEDEFLNYYPEYLDSFEYVKYNISTFIEEMEDEWKSIQEHGDLGSRKNLAYYALKTSCPDAIFSLYDKKFSGVEEYLFSKSNERMLEIIGVKDND